MGYAIMRWGKIKFGGIAAAEYHQRTKLHKNCEHPEMRDSNFTVKQFEDESLRKTVKRFMMQQQEPTGRKLRKECDALIGKKASLQSEIKDLEKRYGGRT